VGTFQQDVFVSTPVSGGGNRAPTTDAAVRPLGPPLSGPRAFSESDFNALVGGRGVQASLVATTGSLPVPTRGLRPGERGPHVELVQRYLEVYTQTRLPSGPDGVYGQETEALVSRFQELNGLTQDGIAGEQTLRRMGFLQPPTRLTLESTAKEPTVDQFIFLISKQFGFGNHEEMKGWIQNALHTAGVGVRSLGDTNGNGRYEFQLDIPTSMATYLSFEYHRLTGQALPADGSAPTRQVEDGIQVNTPRSVTQSTPLSVTQGQQVSRTWEMDGRTVRVAYEDGTQAVVARDGNGRLHTFPDERFTGELPITGATFDAQIPSWRQQQLRNVGYELINSHGEGRVGDANNRPTLDFRDFGAILNDLAGRTDMTELEKAYTWTFIANAKGEATLDFRGFVNGQYDVSLEGMPDEVADSHPFRRSNSPNHSVLGFSDGYHAPLGNLSPEAAREEIENHESVSLPFGGPRINLNPGDTEASWRLGEAFRAFREGGFSAFAETWNRNFVVP
jgi:peptidoglycan hydrolase-like protein with peptidoglycan-binding domain